MDYVIQMALQKTYAIILGLILAGGLILCIAVFGLHLIPVKLFSGPEDGHSLSAMQGGFGGGLDTLILDTELPDSPTSIPLYTISSIDFVQDMDVSKTFSVKSSVPSADEAPALAEKGLEKYGGLPKDAQLDKVIPNYVYRHNLTTNTDEEKRPVGIQVFYKQVLNGLPVKHSGINIHLGENGEVIDIVKVWGNYTYAGETKVISSEKAYEKLRNPNSTEKFQGGFMKGYKIKDVQLGYNFDWNGHHAKDTLINTTLKPVWIFSMADPSEGFVMVDATDST
jgi:hypothetical protein